MDGVEMGRRIRERFPAERLPVIALTAYPEYDIVVDTRYPFQAFLRKPVPIEQLAKTISEVVEGRTI
jgi:CheY-like chemotaxis protein